MNVTADEKGGANARTQPRLELYGITKAFPGVVANADVSLSVHPGEIHALLGENGAGKSTLMKMIYGLLAPDSGSLMWDGREIRIEGPMQARALGMGMVQQHFALLESLTVAENLALTLNRHGRWDPNRIAARIEDAEREYGLKVHARRPVHRLSVGERQRVEILRCLLQEEPLKLLILDEPTAVLTPQEIEGLFAILRRLAADGLSILFVSHKLEEVRGLCDRVTVLRSGRVVARRDTADVSVEDLAALMVGDAPPPLRERKPVALEARVRMAVSSLSQSTLDPHGTALQSVNFELRQGEILGLAGVSGNGQQELMAALVGERSSPPEAILIDGQAVGKLNVRARRKLGLRYVPEERLGKGAVPELSLIDNVLLTRWAKAMQWGLLRLGQARAAAQSLCDRHDVRHPGVASPAASLSGGNLQKFIMGRELDEAPEILIVAQPTWGVDVAAARRIQDGLLALRERGSALLVISDDLDELLLLSDRIAVMSGGRVSPVCPVASVDRAELGQWMGGNVSGWEAFGDAA
ncbi:ABC transporter ATP-binding protein [Mangrovitalea sediminis]|uniref:ABC transporter ATP-binding protein n=1 Tax=Mangrovitalea sediminis TaxID=1982043 RepID=UPI000BE5FCA0|nr:ABC transporter ATP-binding protein [Mangrovitalea sediminis]